MKGNCRRRFATLLGLDWEAQRRAGDSRWERYTIHACTLAAGQLAFRHALQAFRMTRTHSYGISSLAAAELLALMRGHWQVESGKHFTRDVTYGGTRAASGPGRGRPARCRP